MPASSDDAFTPLALESGDGARAAILPYGAHLTAWHPAPAAPDGSAGRLFLSAHAEHRAGAAVRGGVPVIFPQFAAEGPFVRHGFARTRAWTVVRVGRDGDAATAELALADDEATRALWPYAFALRYVVRVAGDTLSAALTVENRDDESFRFTTALHSYLAVGDVERVTVHGLEGSPYRDQTAAGRLCDPAQRALHLAGEVDRVYLDVAGPVRVDDAAAGRALRITQEGFADVVVWNPGAERAAALGDLDQPDGWRRFLCIEAARVGDPVELAPGARWTGVQHFTAAAREIAPRETAARETAARETAVRATP